MDLVHVVCIGVLNWFIVYLMHINQQIIFLVFDEHYIFDIYSRLFTNANKQTNKQTTKYPPPQKKKEKKKHIQKCPYEEYGERNADYILLYEPVHGISNNEVCATSKASDQPAHMRSLIRAFASRLSILWLLSY